MNLRRTSSLGIDVVLKGGIGKVPFDGHIQPRGKVIYETAVERAGTLGGGRG